MAQAAGKKAAKKAAAKDETVEQAPVEDSSSIENAAPLDPPTNDAEFEDQGEGEGEGGGQEPNDAPADDSAPQPPADDEDTDGDNEAADGADEDEGKDADEDEGGEGATPTQDPTTARIEPPAEKPVKDEGPKQFPTLTDAAAERLRITKQVALVRDEHDEKVDPEGLFTAPGPDGQVRCTKRLIQHTTETVHDRHVRTLLLAKGARVSEHGARAILARIQAERA